MFITLVDSLRVSCMMHKFVDDTTLSEFIAKSGRSGMNACCDELVQQSNEIKMNVNGRKTRDAAGSDCKKINSLIPCAEQRSVVFQHSSF